MITLQYVFKTKTKQKNSGIDSSPVLVDTRMRQHLCRPVILAVRQRLCPAPPPASYTRPLSSAPAGQLYSPCGSASAQRPRRPVILALCPAPPPVSYTRRAAAPLPSAPIGQSYSPSVQRPRRSVILAVRQRLCPAPQSASHTRPLSSAPAGQLYSPCGSASAQRGSDAG